MVERGGGLGLLRRQARQLDDDAGKGVGARRVADGGLEFSQAGVDGRAQGIQLALRGVRPSLAALLVAVDVEPRTRAEDLALDDFVRITDALLAAGVVAA